MLCPHNNSGRISDQNICISADYFCWPQEYDYLRSIV